jgi:hypothetical protein
MGLERLEGLDRLDRLEGPPGPPASPAPPAYFFFVLSTFTRSPSAIPRTELYGPVIT